MFWLSDKTMLAIVISFVLSLILSYFVRLAARRFGFVAKPKADRWHKKPTAMMGGVAIFLTTIISYFLFVPYTNQSLIVIIGSSFLFFIGLIDDILQIKPYQKLFGQIIGTAFVVGSGLTLQWTAYEPINILITAFWIIGITNALNLLDNMDGLATGIAAVAAMSLAFNFSINGQLNEFLLIAVFISSLLGFLVYNFNPASIFMGDCGSMFIGFLLASSVLLNQVAGRSRSVLPILLVPVLVLFVPIFDTTFVTILRKMWGRSASQGGRDHTSHRLVALGLSERSAVLLLYALAALSGLLAIFVRELPTDQSLFFIALFTIALIFGGVYLANVKVYEEQDEEEALSNNAVFGFFITISYKRRIFELVLDSFLIAISYYGAYLLLFGSIEATYHWNLFLKTLPILIVLKLGAFLLCGVYRGMWRYTSINDLVTFGKGTALGSVVSILAILLIYRFQGFSRAVFVLDVLILLVLLASSRMAFRFLRQILPSPQAGDGRRILIFGAGDGGELALRELNRNPELKYHPIGFLDDDPLKKGKVIHGLKVFGGNGTLREICRQHEIEEILLACRNIKEERLNEIKRECQSVEVDIKRATFKIEPLDNLFN